MQLRKLVPGLTRRRVTIGEGPDMGRRVRVYVLPPLEDCRAVFSEQLNQAVPWEDDGP